ncbi:ubiquitin carboxyl-terminal hydrolase 18-like isoform X1 [Coffea arabica]|uniref:Ubiquitin carboxyl-terminal hydrolase 18-like isoform X1 n=2 Tax=Coffea arabica TaxID=13443 RepID=A0A6P6TSZ6_COFAR
MSLLAAVDLNWPLQFVVTVFIVAFGLLHLVKNTASKYFLAEDSDPDNDHVSEWSSAIASTAAEKNSRNCNNSSSNNHMMMMTTTSRATEEVTRGTAAPALEDDACAVCGNRTKKKCSGCKMVMYCSEVCQRSHWRSEHKLKCKDFQLSGRSLLGGRRASSTVSLVNPGGSSKVLHQTKKILFPYEEFVELFNWDKPGFPPCGLLNCGNSCFANVVLQCLAYTRPLVAFLLKKGHRRECRRNDSCFLCEFQTHVERASESLHPFSPINILSRLPNIGGNLGYGKQEDAHEFMRFAIDTMQSVCLDEFGGERAVHPTSQETTLIQHIFGGHLQSQVICTKCNNVSNQFENMLDLTVEIHGDSASLEECLDQFTAKEWLHGDNMYKCDGCNDYVMAWKRLTVRHAPNILTIALKRFQSGRFGKLNKRVAFPETLDLRPYMSETGGNNDIYKLYAVIVHVDMLNASFFGHYICYIKDFRGKWYRIDDCKVVRVDLDEVLSQGAYMLLYSRICARSSSLYPVEPLKEEKSKNAELDKVEPSAEHPVECLSRNGSTDKCVDSVVLPSEANTKSEIASLGEGVSSTSNSDVANEHLEMMVDLEGNSSVSVEGELCQISGSAAAGEEAAHLGHAHGIVSQNNASKIAYNSSADVSQMKPSSNLFNIKDESTCSGRTPEELFPGHSSQQDIVVATENHAYEREGMLPDVAAVKPSTSEVLETKIANPRHKAVKVVDGMLSSNGVKDAERKADGKRCRAKVKPLFPPGFLEKRSQNKFIKRGDKVSMEVDDHISSCNTTYQINGIAKPDLSCQTEDGTVNGDDAHSGCYSKVSACISVEKVGMPPDEDAPMVISESAEASHMGDDNLEIPIS